MVSATLSSTVVVYLRQLELELKQLSGVQPEEALSDAREYLVDFVSELDATGVVDQAEQEARVMERFGTPREVANQYGDVAIKGRERKGYAPGWRICCCTCGRSKPAARSGIVRIKAFSREKYVGGFCSHCRWFRWLRLIHDMDQTNLTDQMCANLTPAETLQGANRPWRLLCLIVGGVLAINAIVWGVLLQLIAFD